MRSSSDVRLAGRQVTERACAGSIARVLGRVEVSDREIADAVEVGIATNHQGGVEWHEHARATRSLEPEHVIEAALAEAAEPQEFVAAFLQPPLFSTAYDSGMGTLYTAVYKPVRGSVEYRWPSTTWEHSFERFREGTRTIRLLETTAA